MDDNNGWNQQNQNQGYSYYDPTANPIPPKTAQQIRAEKRAEKKAKRSENGGARKFFRLVLSAIIFGLVAGATMFGVNKLGEKLDPSPAKEIEIPTTSVGNVVLNDENTPVMIQNEEENYTTLMNVKNVVKSAMPSIVAINGKVPVSGSIFGYPYGGTSQGATTSGTGIIVGKNDTELLMVTNAHVVDGVNDLKCTFADDESVTISVKGSKANKDIAVVAASLSDIKNSTLSKIAIAELGDSDAVELGDQVVAIGNALGEGQSATVGYVSALNRSITIEGMEFSNLIMTDAAINPGNSGGALLNADGRVIGINSAKSASSDVEGMGYAIPISSVRDILDNLMNKKLREQVPASQSSYLGIYAVDVTSSIAKAYGYPKGTMIQRVEEDSPADLAGLVKGDIIVGFDGESITSFNGLRSLMKYYASGENVIIEFYRMEKGEYILKSIEVTLGHNK